MDSVFVGPLALEKAQEDLSDAFLGLFGTSSTSFESSGLMSDLHILILSLVDFFP